MMLAKAAAKLIPRDTTHKAEREAPWTKDRRDDDLLKKPHGPAVKAARMPMARKAPLSFHKPSGRK